MHRWHEHVALHTTQARIINRSTHDPPGGQQAMAGVSFLDRKVYFRVGEPGWRRVRPYRASRLTLPPHRVGFGP